MLQFFTASHVHLVSGYLFSAGLVFAVGVRALRLAAARAGGRAGPGAGMGTIRRLAMACACALLLGWSSPVSAQFFSPGQLSRAHSALEGLEKCAKCHEERKGLSAHLCLECHTELQTRVAKGAGFHGHLPAAKKQECQSCHPDHRGLDFAMVDWEGGRDKFDHHKTGWPLKGAHTKAHCDDCHQKRLIVDGAVRHLLEKEPRRVTLLGASTKCASCHFDEHRGQLDHECQKCHTEIAWKPVPAFNHQTTAYPLLGKHRAVVCSKCHTPTEDDQFLATAFPRPRAPTFMQMKPLDHQTCESCHTDPHKGSLGPNCSGCHTEAGWKVIRTGPDQDTSFHDKTKFPLRGGHIGVACKSCHQPVPGQPARFKGLAFGACTDCHEDGHMGQLHARPPAKVVACEGCHTVNAFVPARFEREQHQSTKFPLEDAHAAVACRGCHPTDPGLAARIPTAVRQRLKLRKRPERFSFVVLHPKKSPQACNQCHEDVHLGQFTEGKLAARVGGRLASEVAEGSDTCAQCHKITSFADLTFDHDKDSRFALTGKHADTPCAGCHRPQKIANGRTFVRYKPIDLACASCHTDYHQGQFLVAAAKSGKARGCDFCHKTSKFTDTIFEHNNPDFSPYPLEGKHASIACARCHPRVQVAPEVETVRYRPLPRACEDCHVDFHHGEFRGFEP
jgi:hypothetical protein